MNLSQVKWAATHDWFVRSRRTPYGTFIVEVKGWTVGPNGFNRLDEQTFASFPELKEWSEKVGSGKLAHTSTGYAY